MLSRAKTTFHEFPRKFWVLVLATFIDRLGGTLIGPFFALYVTQRFNVGMTQAGVLFAIFSVSGMAGGMFGGALTDKFGRKTMLLFGLVISALSSVSMGLVGQLSVFYTLAVFVGLLSSIGFPAQQAMVADMLPEEKHAEGFGILRVAANISWILGPTIGGFLAARSYLSLFILDAVASLITAGIVLRMIPETRPDPSAAQERESLFQTLKGYRSVLADRLYVGFLVVSMLMLLVYQQLYNTLSVYLRDVHGVPTQGYGMLMSMNAAVVVVAQFWITRQVGKRPPLLMMALGTAFYMVGFTMWGLVFSYPLFMVAMLLITVGEMVVVPVGQAIAARFAPEAMRGRYMAFFGLSWAVPSAIGPWAAGLILDNYDPNWVWYLGGIICAVAIIGFYALHARTKERFAVPISEAAGLEVPA